MASQRRRYRLYRRRWFLISAILALFGTVLVIISLISFLAPYHSDFEHIRLHHHSSQVSNGRRKLRIQEGGGRSKRGLWSSRNARFYHGCSNASNKFAKAEAVTQPDRYLEIVTSGGLNQQRTGITDAVVAARILNATLVVPKLDEKSFWKDNSNFSEIFDVDWFISFLSKDVKIIKQLPKKEGKTWYPITTMRVPRKCNEKCYQTRVLPVLLKRHAVQLGKFDYRLANRLDTELQKLRCRVNYRALKFTKHIFEMGRELVGRMRMKSEHYIALHLRFEPDMLAFSGCYYGGGEKEREELGAIRRRWKTLHSGNPEKARRQGRCPLTPKEVGLMLRALGYGEDVNIYVASGEVYGGEETLAPLKALFPNLYSKETIASKEELQPYASFSSRMAALDFIVCDESDVFVTNNNGNMAKILAGRRRYFGHKPTIRPNAKKLYRLFLNQGNNNMTWEEYASKVNKYQRGFMGGPNEVRPGRGEFHENPSACICEDSEAKKGSSSSGPGPGPRKFGNSTKKSVELTDDSEMDDEPEMPDQDDDAEDENRIGLQTTPSLNETVLDYDVVTLLEEPELDMLFSD